MPQADRYEQQFLDALRDIFVGAPVVGKEFAMTLIEQIQQQVNLLPPEKQSEVLDFVTFLRERRAMPAKPRALRQHPAFGAWRGRNIDALQYEQALRAEWDEQA
jgi:hypothetical protein